MMRQGWNARHVENFRQKARYAMYSKLFFQGEREKLSGFDACLSATSLM
jgi:hypothetical protein